MFDITGPYLVLAMLLLVSGTRKLRFPERAVRQLRAGGLPATTAVVHAFGSAQLAIAVGALLAGGARFAVLAAVACLARSATFALTAWRCRATARTPAGRSARTPVGTPVRVPRGKAVEESAEGSVHDATVLEAAVRDFTVRAVVCVGAVVVAGVAAVADVGSMPRVMAPEPLFGVPFLVATVACAWCLTRAAAALSGGRPHP